MENENITGNNLNVSDEKFSLLDYLTGILYEPSNVFQKIKNSTPKHSYWVYPLVIFLVVALITNVIIMSNAELKSEIMYKQKIESQKRLDQMVKDGKLTPEQAEKAQEQTEKGLEIMAGPLGIVINVVSTVVFTFLFFILLSLIYFLIWNKILKGDGNFHSALISTGGAYIISAFEIIIILIISLITSSLVKEVSAVSILNLNIEEGSLLKYVLSKLNPFTIWVLSIQGIALSKLFNVIKKNSIIIVFFLWVIYLILAYLLGTFLPFLRG